MMNSQTFQTEDDKFNATEKTLLILLFFARNNTPIGTTELADALNFNKATVSRNLKFLKNYGYVTQDSITKRYSLGPAIIQLWKSMTKDIDSQCIIIAQPYCDSLRDRIAETVHFEILSGDHMFLAYAARCHNPISVSIAIGDRVFPHTHVGAKCIAAYSHPRLAQKWLSDLVSERLKIEELTTEYEEIVSRGFSIDNGRFDKNIYAIAVPVFDRNSRAVGSVVALTPIMRKEQLMQDSVIDALKQTAEKITERLMCPTPYQNLCKIYS